MAFRKINIRSPYKRFKSKIKKALTREKAKRKPRLSNRAKATKRFISSKFKKRINKRTNLIRGVKAIRKSKSTRAKVSYLRPKIKRVFVPKVPKKRNLFAKLKSISKKLKVAKRKYILPVGFGIAKKISEDKEQLKGFFVSVKEKMAIKKREELARQARVKTKRKEIVSKVGNWMKKNVEKEKERQAILKQKRKDIFSSVKEKGLFGSVVDIFKGAGSYKDIPILENSEEVRTIEEEEKQKLIKNVAIGAGLVGLGFILTRGK